MNTFLAQLSQLFMSASEDSWLAGLCDLLQAHTGAWVRLTGRGGRLLTESMPSSGICPENPDYYIEKPILAEGAIRGGIAVVCKDAVHSVISGSDTILGCISISRNDTPFTSDEEQMLDISSCICILLLRQQEKSAILQHKQRVDAVREAINALSFSELEAAVYISQALGGPEGRLVAGHVADKLGFTRSIVVTALKKLEGAGIIETRSLGVKGTHIRVREPLLIDELSKLGTASGKMQL